MGLWEPADKKCSWETQASTFGRSTNEWIMDTPELEPQAAWHAGETSGLAWPGVPVSEVAWKHPPCARHRDIIARSHKGSIKEGRGLSTKQAQQPQKQQKQQATIRCSQGGGNNNKNCSNCCAGLYATVLLTSIEFLLPPQKWIQVPCNSAS